MHMIPRSMCVCSGSARPSRASHRVCCRQVRACAQSVKSAPAGTRVRVQVQEQEIQGVKSHQWVDGTLQGGSTSKRGLVSTPIKKGDERETYDDQNTKNGKSKKGKVNNKDVSAKESEKIVEGVRRFRHDAK
jgi:hypothetical protein